MFLLARTALLVAIGFALAACWGRSADEAATDSAAVAIDSSAVACVRGEADPLFAGSDFQAKGPLRAVESVRTGSPIELTVRHSGCAHYVLDLEFTWGEGATPGRAGALEEAASLLESLAPLAADRALAGALVRALRSLAADTTVWSIAQSETESVSVTRASAGTLQLRYDVAL